MINVTQQSDTVEIIQSTPVANITVASGLNGRRGSYYFVGNLDDPNTASSYIEITGLENVQPILYDVFFSNTTTQQWQYRYDTSGNLNWENFNTAVTVPVRRYTENITANTDTFNITHNLNSYLVVVTVFTNPDTGPKVDVGCYVHRTDLNTVQIKLIENITTPEKFTVLIASFPMV